MTKYDPLERYLAACGKEEITLRFDEIEAILADELPPSAKRWPAWWSDPSSHPHVRAWLDAGYRASPDFRGKKAVFRRNGASPRPVEAKTASAHMPEACAAVPAAFESAGEVLTVCGYPFRFLQELIPLCENGKVRRFYPQRQYDNQKGLPLSRYGAGPFCRFSVRAPAAPGVYLWVCQGEIVYIGETQDLSQRFNMGYGNISPRNCYLGGQSTNCKMNRVVMDCYEKGTPIRLYFYKTTDYKRVELELLRRYHTKYNVKDNEA